MINAHISRKNTVPWWAVIGAPLIGVPLIVALLALAAPERDASGADTDPDFAVEQVEVEPVGSSLEAPAVTSHGLFVSC